MSSPPVKPDNPRLLLRHALRNDLGLFVRRAWPGMQWSWHHDAIVHQLSRVLTGKTRRLIINAPPRGGKSNIANVIFPAFALGRRPDLNIVGVSYALNLSGKHARLTRDIMEQQWYREVFPGTVLTRKAEEDYDTSRGGGRLSTSVGGTLTGRGGNLFIMDDVIKPDEVHSETARQNLNEWFQRTATSRLDDKRTGAMILLMQRLHQYDLTGLLMELGGWDVLTLPAIAQRDQLYQLTRGHTHLFRAGDLLDPVREPMSVLSNQKSMMGSATFAAQYLQDPLPAEGNLFRAEWLRIYCRDEEPQEGEVIQSWDTGIKIGEHNSYSVGVTARLVRNHVYIMDVWRGRLEFPDLERKVCDLARLHRVTTLLIEDKASGQELVQNLRSNHHPGVPLPIARNPKGEKIERAAGISSMVEAGHVFLPDEAPWLAEFLSELLAFPSGKFDDQVDAFTQLLSWVRARAMTPSVLNVGPEEASEQWDYSIDEHGGFDPWGPS